MQTEVCGVPTTISNHTVVNSSIRQPCYFRSFAASDEFVSRIRPWETFRFSGLSGDSELSNDPAKLSFESHEIEEQSMRG